jgi:hypothetical protein
MPGIRPFAQGDVVQVADLVWKVLHEKKGPAPKSLSTYFEELFLRNPWVGEGVESRIYEDQQGKVVGFFGALARPMTLQGKRVLLAFGSNFVMDPESRATMAAIQLVRAFMKGPQDVSITDSANENSRQLLRSLGFNVVPIYSLLWARPLRPSIYGLGGVARLKKSSTVATIATVLKPICELVDGLAGKMKISPFRQTFPDTIGDTLDLETLYQCLSTIPSKHFLLPEYSKASLAWIIDFLDHQEAFGELRKVLVRDKNQKALGWYIYGCVPGAVGEVLQIGSESASVGKVLEHLFYDAWRNGATGLHGRLEPQFMQELTSKSSFFIRNGSWTLVHSSRPELLAVIQSGTAFFSRLDGEWALRPPASPL